MYNRFYAIIQSGFLSLLSPPVRNSDAAPEELVDLSWLSTEKQINSKVYNVLEIKKLTFLKIV